MGSIIITGGAAIYPPLATTTVNGVLKLATNSKGIEGTDNFTAMTPLRTAEAITARLFTATETVAGIITLEQISGTVRPYTRQQYNAPVVRVGASGIQAVDCDLHQLLSITATGALAFAAPTNLTVGKTLTIQIYSATTIGITWDASYLSSSAYTLPSSTTAGRIMAVTFLCHKDGALLMTGVVEEA